MGVERKRSSDIYLLSGDAVTSLWGKSRGCFRACGVQKRANNPVLERSLSSDGEWKT